MTHTHSFDYFHLLDCVTLALVTDTHRVYLNTSTQPHPNSTCTYKHIHTPHTYKYTHIQIYSQIHIPTSRLMYMSCVQVCPTYAPETKLRFTRKYGAEVLKVRVCACVRVGVLVGAGRSRSVSVSQSQYQPDSHCHSRSLSLTFTEW